MKEAITTSILTHGAYNFSNYLTVHEVYDKYIKRSLENKVLINTYMYTYVEAPCDVRT